MLLPRLVVPATQTQAGKEWIQETFEILLRKQQGLTGKAPDLDETSRLKKDDYKRCNVWQRAVDEIIMAIACGEVQPPSRIRDQAANSFERDIRLPDSVVEYYKTIDDVEQWLKISASGESVYFAYIYKDVIRDIPNLIRVFARPEHDTDMLGRRHLDARKDSGCSRDLWIH